MKFRLTAAAAGLTFAASSGKAADAVKIWFCDNIDNRCCGHRQ